MKILRHYSTSKANWSQHL